MKKFLALMVSMAMLISVFSFSAVAAEPVGVLGPNLVLNGDFEEPGVPRIVKGSAGFDDLPLNVPPHWELAGPTHEDTYNMFDSEGLLGRKRRGNGESYRSGNQTLYYTEGFYQLVDMANPHPDVFRISGDRTIGQNGTNTESKTCLFIGSYMKAPSAPDVWSDEINIEAGKTYRLTYDVFTGGIYGVGIRFFDAKGKVFQSVSALPYTLDSVGSARPARVSPEYTEHNNRNNTGEPKEVWFTRSADYIAPKGAVKARVMLGWMDTNAGRDGKVAYDNIKLQEVYEKKLVIKGDAKNLVATNATLKDGKAEGVNFVDITPSADNAVVETDFIDTFGQGKYWVRFNTAYESNAKYTYSVEYFDAAKNQLDKAGEIVAPYSKSLTLQNTVTLRGNGGAQSNEIPVKDAYRKDITFDAPKGTKYFKLYFVPEKQSNGVLTISNLEGAYRPATAPEANDLASVNEVFNSSDENGNLCGITFAKVTSDAYVTGGNMYKLVDYGMVFSKTNNNPEVKGLNCEKVPASAPKGVLGHYGVKYIGTGIVAGRTYYSRPYATYSFNGEEVTVYGDTLTFTPGL